MIEKILERLAELYDRNDRQKKTAYEEQDWEKFDLFMHRNEGVYSALAIVQEVAKDGGWIPCSERLPDTTNWDAGTIRKLFLVSYEPDPVSKLWVGIRYFNKGTNKFGGDEKVIAWQPLPPAYRKEN